jgi:glycosyltransferase involved in cell wall biosynthesis
MVGRISKQKGFEFFNQVARLLSHRAHFKWIGGGDDDCESLLRNNGVEVTGWITRNEVVAHLKGLDLYFHSAAWEGFPISVLETGQLGIPMVLRDIGPFTAEGLPVVENVGKTVQLIEKWLDEDQYTREMCHATTTQINEYHSVTRLKKALSDLYGSFDGHA